MDTHLQDQKNITAFFDDRTAAETAVRRLTEADVPSDQISMVEGTDPSADPQPAERQDEGFMATLKSMFMGDDGHDTYAEGLRRGGYLVSVRAAAADEQRVVDILDKEGSVDLDERSESWRADGWSGAPRQTAPDGAGDGTIEVMEEDMRIGKRDVSHGRVQVRAHTVEEQVSEDVTLRSEHVEIDRHPVDREVSAANANAGFQDQTIEVEERSEEAVVDKTAHVVEEIDLNKTSRQDTETVGGTVRHTEVEVDDDRKR